MTSNIKFAFRAKAFKYLKKLNTVEREKTVHQIVSKVNGFLKHNDRRYVFQDHFFSKIGNFDSTIYYIRIDLNRRAIISIDEDPIFGVVKVIIYSICSHDNLQREINGIMQSLYQKMLNDTSNDEEETE